MFGFFQKKRTPPVDPPTEKQLRYAKRLGITVRPEMSKQDVSAAIGAAESAHPQLAAGREKVKKKTRERKYGPELIQQEEQWNRFADTTEFILAVYQRGKDLIVDVLRVNEAFIDDRGKLVLGVESPKLMKDRHIGDHLEWECHFELLIEKLRHYEPLHAEFWNDGIDAYRRTVERGLKLARKL